MRERVLDVPAPIRLPLATPLSWRHTDLILVRSENQVKGGARVGSSPQVVEMGLVSEDRKSLGRRQAEALAVRSQLAVAAVARNRHERLGEVAAIANQLGVRVGVGEATMRACQMPSHRQDRTGFERHGGAEQVEPKVAIFEDRGRTIDDQLTDRVPAIDGDDELAHRHSLGVAKARLPARLEPTVARVKFHADVGSIE